MSTGADTFSQRNAADGFEFASKLSEGRQRFLSRAIEHSLRRGRRTPSDFVRHFPPDAIMKGLEHNAALRAYILASTTGIKEKIALKKPWEDAAGDLKLALEEGETNAEAIVELFTADERVRHLDAQKLWKFLSEGDFWNIVTDKAAATVAREHVAYLLDAGLEEKLLDQRDIVDAITVQELATRLPREELGALLRRALDNAQHGKTFTQVDLLACTGARTLLEYVPLSHIWQSVVRPCIATRHGYEVKPEASAVQASPAATATSTPLAMPAPPPNLPAQSSAASQDAWSIPPDPNAHKAAKHASMEEDPDEVTRVMPSSKFEGPKLKPTPAAGKPPPKKAGMPQAMRQSALVDDGGDLDVEVVDDAKAV